MLWIQLREVVLLKCIYEQRVEGDVSEESNKGETPATPDDVYSSKQLLELAVNTNAADDELICVIDGRLEDEQLPFKLSFEMGFAYSLPGDNDQPPMAEVEPTLIWLAFPYMRQLVADLTGRSPSGQYFLPPLTRLPQPEEATESSDNPSNGE